MRQLLLGVSSDKRLVLVYPMSQDDSIFEVYECKAHKPQLYSINSSAGNGEALVNRLPAELLRKCFEFSIDASGLFDKHNSRPCQCKVANDRLPRQDYSTAQAISLTCSRFLAISRPVLYSWIRLAPSQSSLGCEIFEKRILRRFVRTINTAYSLRNYIISLSIPMKSFSRLAMATETNFVRLRKLDLTITGTCTAQEWIACYTNLCGLPKLVELSISLGDEATCGLPSFTRIVSALGCLSKLVLKGVRSRKDYGDDISSMERNLVRLPNTDISRREQVCAKQPRHENQADNRA